MTDEIKVPDADRDRWELVINQLHTLNRGQATHTGAISRLTTTLTEHIASHTKRSSLAPLGRGYKSLPLLARILIPVGVAAAGSYLGLDLSGVM